MFRSMWYLAVVNLVMAKRARHIFSGSTSGLADGGGSATANNNWQQDQSEVVAGGAATVQRAIIHRISGLQHGGADKSILVVALELLSGLTQGLGMELQPLIAVSNPNLLSLLTVCLKHPQAPVRQSSYMLVDDMAMGCFVLLHPHMPGIMAELTLQLDPEPKYNFISASNNTAWSVSEVVLRYGQDDLEFKHLHENAAMSIGQIGLMHPGLVAVHLPEFVQAWCQASNLPGIAKSLLWFCNAVGFKQHDPAEWTFQVTQFPQAIQEHLATRCGA
ncbi:hypothetical protein C8J57DRAFT_1592973 [Mycena rebaudengoi]|nr:hypothetical protein C8J57DRAFT_1592973 [Mycena rebaudengoi]